MNYFDDYDRRRERADNDKENSARLAHAYATYESTGLGTIQFEEACQFELVFIERPYVSHSCYCDPDDLATALGYPDSTVVPFPNSTGFVVTWQQDENDFYTGAWIAVRVNFAPEDLIPPTVQPVLQHHFTFSAIAMKDIPPTMEDAVKD